MRFRAMTMAYRSAFPAGRFQMIMLNKAPTGCLITDNDPTRFQIVCVALLPEWRDRGIGTALTTSVLGEAASRNLL
jgi:ribosomal protein S18 acetylase RimI-like enzyme